MGNIINIVYLRRKCVYVRKILTVFILSCNESSPKTWGSTSLSTGRWLICTTLKLNIDAECHYQTTMAWDVPSN